jgi:hypothetical protein
MSHGAEVLGGGVAELSASHELAYAADRKTRRTKLPLFPAFYKHLPDTMKAIPYRHCASRIIRSMPSIHSRRLIRPAIDTLVIRTGWIMEADNFPPQLMPYGTAPDRAPPVLPDAL